MNDFDSRQVRHREARELAAGYSKAIRALDIASITVFFLVVGWQGIRLAEHTPEAPWLMVAAFAGGYLFADFVSGLFHWMADSWGKVETPLVGKAFLRPFREHHVDQKAITHHDFIETNGNNCLICLPVAIVVLFVPVDYSPAVFFLFAWLFWSMLWVFGTNQFHKWAHMEAPPKLVGFLQRWHLILPPDHHAIHHTAPYATHYCITTGWMNRPLAAIGFYRAMEWAITAISGALPRADDIGAKAAQALQQAQAEELAAALALAQPQAAELAGASTNGDKPSVALSE